MDLSSILLVVIVFLAATAACVILFQRLGFGAILGFIVAGIIIGPHTPGPVPLHAVEELQNIAEFGVVLFMFTVGLEMQPRKVWAMRRLIFGLGSAQMLVTAAGLAAYMIFFVGSAWQTATIVGLAFAMSSTAIVMATLGERGELAKEHGRTAFAILMAQDLWIVPVMALIPLLAHASSQTAAIPVWQKAGLVLGVLLGTIVVGRYLLPAVLGYCASRRQMDAFLLVVFLAVTAAAWSVDQAGISMTLGVFVLGMMLSASDFRYQLMATVGPFKQILMGLFFIAVGMSIDVPAILDDWRALLVHVPVVLFLKGAILIGLLLAFRVGRAAAVRTGFYLSQVGEFAFVLLGVAAVSGLLSDHGHTLAMLVVAVSMIATPLMVQAGDRLAGLVDRSPASLPAAPAEDLDRHVVIIGFEEVGQLVHLMLERAGIPHIAVDRDIDVIRQCRRAGRPALLGDMSSQDTRDAVGLEKAAAVFITSRDTARAKALAVTLHRLYPKLNVYVRVRSIADQDELVARGVRHAGTGYIESTLARGAMLLKDLGLSPDDANELVEALRRDNYRLIRSALPEGEGA
ncbi:MAG: cation:proton antiporter [Thiohalocapsa sp.]|jgi:glutathione-regulated potassium-efflux system protein KefB